MTLLCDQCRSMFHPPIWGEHHADIASLRKAAAADGCYICQPLLQYALGRSGALENCMAQPYTYSVLSSDLKTEILIGLILLIDGEEVEETRSFLVVPSSESSTGLSARTKNAAIPVAEACCITKKWMRSCATKHDVPEERSAIIVPPATA